MNIRTFFSSIAGSSEKDIEYIERAIVKNLPFGLGCFRSKVLFVPQTFTGYWLWNDLSPGPVFQAKGLTEFLDTVKMQYLTHKDLITTEELLEITKALTNDRTKQRLDDLQRPVLSQPAIPARSVAAGRVRVIPGKSDGRKALPESTSSAAEPIVLPESIRDAKDLPCDGSEDPAGARG